MTMTENRITIDDLKKHGYTDITVRYFTQLEADIAELLSRLAALEAARPAVAEQQTPDASDTPAWTPPQGKPRWRHPDEDAVWTGSDEEHDYYAKAYLDGSFVFDFMMPGFMNVHWFGSPALTETTMNAECLARDWHAARHKTAETDAGESKSSAESAKADAAPAAECPHIRSLITDGLLALDALAAERDEAVKLAEATTVISEHYCGERDAAKAELTKLGHDRDSGAYYKIARNLELELGAEKERLKMVRAKLDHAYLVLEKMTAERDEARRKLAEVQSALDTDREVLKSIQESLWNLYAYCNDDSKWNLPMSGNCIAARDTIHGLRTELAAANRKAADAEGPKPDNAAGTCYGHSVAAEPAAPPAPALPQPREIWRYLTCGEMAAADDEERNEYGHWLRIRDPGRTANAFSLIRRRETVYFASDVQALVSRLSARLNCGHPVQCNEHSAETGDVLYCGWCNAVSYQRDLVTDNKERAEKANAELTAAKQRIAELEAELQSAADALQPLLPIGEVKAIGLREVAAGIKALAALRSQSAKLPADLAALLERIDNNATSDIPADILDDLRAYLATAETQPDELAECRAMSAELSGDPQAWISYGHNEMGMLVVQADAKINSPMMQECSLADLKTKLQAAVAEKGGAK